MTYQLEFDRLLRYDTRKPGIRVPVTLRLNDNAVDLDAKFDTGCTDCVFERAHGEALGLDVESGSLRRFGTATGTFETYGHMVVLSIAAFEYEALVYFAKDYWIDRNVLGQHGFMNRRLVGLNDYAGRLYLGRAPTDLRAAISSFDFVHPTQVVLCGTAMLQTEPFVNGLFDGFHLCRSERPKFSEQVGARSCSDVLALESAGF